MMKNFSKLAIAGAVFALASIAAQAQAMRVSVPFKFHAGSKVMPAGDYRFSVDRMENRVAIVSLDGKTGCFLHVRTPVANVKAAKGRLLFTAYDGAYFLLRVDPREASDGFEVFKSRAEREMAKLNTVREVTAISEVSN